MNKIITNNLVKIQFTMLFLGVMLLCSAESIDEKTIVFSNDLQAINAVIMHPNGKAHFFIRDNFHQYNVQSDKLEKIAKIGRDGWYKLTPNVDAALMHPNRKGYIFKGNMYYRYDFSQRKVDKTGILGVDGWKGVEGPIDAAIMHPTNNSAYFFRGKKYYRFSFSKNKVDKVGTVGVHGWKGLPASIDGALMHTNGKAYFFKGDNYYRYAFGRGVDKKGIIGKDGWKGLFDKLDAAIANDDYGRYFKGTYVTQQDFGKGTNPPLKRGRLGYDWFKGVTANVDAVFHHPYTSSHYYFLKGGKYSKYNATTRKIDETGMISSEWKGVPNNIDAAMTIGKDIYFLKGRKYYKYNSIQRKMILSGDISRIFGWSGSFNIENIDAAYYSPARRQYTFFKKNTAYGYSFRFKKKEVYQLRSDIFK